MPYSKNRKRLKTNKTKNLKYIPKKENNKSKRRNTRRKRNSRRKKKTSYKNNQYMSKLNAFNLKGGALYETGSELKLTQDINVDTDAMLRAGTLVIIERPIYDDTQPDKKIEVSLKTNRANKYRIPRFYLSDQNTTDATIF
tara:strand:+ start:135 stop:557 length:423 start_codon:yes stop_codon:yes gene_type:complete